MRQDSPAALEPQALIVLPPSERAAVALKADQAEADMLAMVERTKEITNVVDKAGRQEAHQAAMMLKNARVAAKNRGEEVREDAVKFQRAVVAVVGRLAAIVTDEETRLIGLRDAFDKKEADEKAERERLAAIRAAGIAAAMQAIRDLPVTLARADSVTLEKALSYLARKELGETEFGDRIGEALALVETTAAALVGLLNAAKASEAAEAARVQAEIEAKRQLAEQAEAQRVEAERLRVQQAEIERQRAIMEELAAINRIGATIGDARAIDSALRSARACRIEGAYGDLLPMVVMARDMAVQSLEARMQTVLALEIPSVIEEAYAMNAEYDAPDESHLVAAHDIDWDEPAPLAQDTAPAQPVPAPIVTIKTPLAQCDAAVLKSFRVIVKELRITRPDAEIRKLLDDELSVMPGVRI